jgi:hypothetical protein
MLPLALRRGRHKPLTITGGAQEQSPTLANASKLLQAMMAATIKRTQESRSKSTTKCQLDAISQYKCTWITQSHFKYAKKQER